MSDTTQSISADTWMNRAAGFELCAHGFLLPAPVLAEALASGEFVGSCREVMENLGFDAVRTDVVTGLLAPYRGVEADELFHDLRKIYTQLFIGEKLPPITPYVGLWATQQRGEEGVLFLTKDSMDIERTMKRCGVGKNLAAGQTNDPVDHVGTLCEFCKFLCLVNARAVEPSPEATILDEDFNAMRDTYLAPFARWLADETPRLTDSGFYRAMSYLLDDLTRDH